MIDAINEENPLESIACNISDQSAISSMSLSEDGTLLATYSSVGCVKIWEIASGFPMLRKLRDLEEKNIDEFYCGTFTPNGFMAVAGKIKNRHRWSEEDGDNHILPCDIKIFNIVENKVVARLKGHSEEVLMIKAVQFKGENYLISTSQDGSIMGWHMSQDWTELLDTKKMEDDVTCMAFNVSFLPNTGNKYFLAATDEHLRLYDFENGKVIRARYY
jgi:WD40 repeat protein